MILQEITYIIATRRGSNIFNALVNDACSAINYIRVICFNLYVPVVAH